MANTGVIRKMVLAVPSPCFKPAVTFTWGHQCFDFIILHLKHVHLRVNALLVVFSAEWMHSLSDKNKNFVQFQLLRSYT